MAEITSGSSFEPNSPRELKLGFQMLQMICGNAMGPKEISKA